MIWENWLRLQRHADGPSTEKQEGPASVRTTDLHVLTQRVLEKAVGSIIQTPTVAGGMLRSRQAAHERQGQHATEECLEKSDAQGHPCQHPGRH